MSFIEKFSKDIKQRKTIASEHSSIDSRQTNITTDEKPKPNKNKKVYFIGVEIIDVESYKEYNQMNILKLESFENNIKVCKECNCTMF